MTSFIQNVQKRDKSMETEHRLVAARGGEREEKKGEGRRGEDRL